MRETMIPNIVGALGIIPEYMEKRIVIQEVGKRIVTILTTALLNNARILWKVLVTWGDLLSFRLQWKNSSYNWCKNLPNNYDNNNPDLVIIKKKMRTCRIVDFAVPADLKVKLNRINTSNLLGNCWTWMWQW